MSRGDYWNTNQVRKWIASIQIDTVDEPCGTTNGWGYVDDIDESLLFGAKMPTTKQDDDDE